MLLMCDYICEPCGPKEESSIMQSDSFNFWRASLCLRGDGKWQLFQGSGWICTWLSCSDLPEIAIPVWLHLMDVSLYVYPRSHFGSPVICLMVNQSPKDWCYMLVSSLVIYICLHTSWGTAEASVSNVRTFPEQSCPVCGDIGDLMYV